MDDHCATIRIPADLHTPIEVERNVDLVDHPPLHVAQVCAGNPDDFGVAFYPSYRGTYQDFGVNHRATMVARAVDNDPEMPPLRGDILLECEPGLATVILDNDLEFQADAKVVHAFRSWMNDYAEANSVEVGAVFFAMAKFVAHAATEAMEDADTKEQVDRLAAMLGIDPSQIGVIHL